VREKIKEFKALFFPEVPPTEQEVLTEKVLKVLKPSLGDGVSNHI
jgi:hypothetical protein